MNKNNEITKNETGQILYATILPILALVLILAGAGYFLLQGEIKLPKLKKEVTEIRRLEGFPTIVSDVATVEKQRVVIKSREELNNFLNEVDPTGKLILKEDINFDKEYLLGVATETNETYGYEMKVKKVIEDKEDNSLLVQAVETRPDDSCDEDKVPNIAIDIVAISKNDRKIEFERVVDETKCEIPEY